MKDHTYNGWRNYETWNVALWMDNEEGSQTYWHEKAVEVFDSAIAEKPFSKEERAKLDLSEIIKGEFEEEMPDLGASTYADLLNAAMSEVDWYEIASHLIDAAVTEKKEKV